MEDNNLVSEEHVDSKQATLGWVKFGITFLVLICFMHFLNRKFETLTFEENKLQILYEIIWILLVSYWIAFSGKLKEQVRHAFIWACLVLVLASAYSYRFEIDAIKNKIIFNLIPEYGHEESNESMRFAMSDDGHFYVRAMIDEIPVRFLVDTGASHIVLSPKTAKKLGYDLKQVKYDKVYETANGIVRGASIKINNFELGKLHIHNVSATINEAPLDTSLLGMSFFNLLSSYEVSKQELTLNWSGQATR
ncbi:MAG: TIGR02281 family clan AA aspartic protease [Thermodesulfobacteriota bacterium]